MPNTFTVGDSLVGGLDLVGFEEAFAALMPERRPPMAPFAANHARLSTVTPFGGAAVENADVIWEQEDDAPAGQNVGATPSGAVNSRDVAYVRRDQVPSLPLNSTIVGGPEHLQKTWRVHSLLKRSDPDFHVAVVV